MTALRKGEVSPLPDFLAFFAFCAVIVLLGSIAWSGSNPSWFLDRALVATCAYLAFRGFRSGILRELLGLLRLALSVAAAWFAGPFIAGYVDLPRIVVVPAASYLTFFVSAIVLKILTGFLVNQRKPPTSIGALLGMFAGLAMALCLFGIAGLGLGMIPLKNLDISDTWAAKMGSELDLLLVAPYVESVPATSPMVLLKVFHEAKSGFDPDKIDVRAIQTQLHGVTAHPKVRKIMDDPEIMKLFEQKNIRGIIENKAFQEFASDPDIGALIETVNWEQVASALRKGVKVERLDP